HLEPTITRSVAGDAFMGIQRDTSFLRRLARRSTRSASIHILMIDPDAGGAQRLLNALPPRFSGTAVTNARDAAAAFEAQRPALVVTEIDLPDASGLDLLSALHASAAYRHVLLMVLTARTSVNAKIAAFQAGADDCLVKPLDPQRFAVHIERLSR